jgi:hypothetical protein
MLPPDAVIEEPTPVEIEVQGPRRSRARHLRWLVLLLPVALLVWWLGQDQSGTILGSHRSWGEIGVLENQSGGPVVVGLDSETALVLAKTGDGGGVAKTQSLVEGGQAVEMAAGTRVRVLESTGRGRVVKVRILAGPWESRKVWVPTRWVR